MRTKHICVLIHIGIKGEVGTVKLVKALLFFSNLPFQGGTSFVDIFYLYLFCHIVLSVFCSFVVTLWERADRLALL